MSDIYDEFRIFEENMNRMFDEIWGIQAMRKSLLPSGERAIESRNGYDKMIFGTFNLQDIWHVWILKKHKHSYKRIDDGKTCGISWQRHQCEDCKKIVGLDDWQIVDLPTDMLYEKV